MSFVEHSTNTSHSIQEEYNYHLEEASYHLKCAEKARFEIEDHLRKFREHNACLKNLTNNFSA